MLLILFGVLFFLFLVSLVLLAPPVVVGVPPIGGEWRLSVDVVLLFKPSSLLLSSFRLSYAGIPALVGVTTETESMLLLAFLLLLEWLMSPGVAAVAECVCDSYVRDEEV
jgi:hypothetical protein